MRMIRLEGHDGPIYINPTHVIVVRRALRDTMIETVSGSHSVKDDPEAVARLLSEDGTLVDITPRMSAGSRK